MKKDIIAIRGVDEDILRKFKVKTIEERMKMGEALTLAMKYWIQEEAMRKVKPSPKNLLKMKPVKVGKKTVRWSEEVDEFLYGKNL